MTRLAESVSRALAFLAHDLSSDAVVERLLAETDARRRLDLTDLNGEEQAQLVASRTVQVLPTLQSLGSAVDLAKAQGRPLRIKLGIDPTSSDVHFGHAVPIIVLSRFQRMGHRIVFIIGDITAKIGDPSGRSDERPALTDDDIARNLATYRAQVAPFFDFANASFHHNSEWLSQVRLPELIGILAHVPVSMALQRDDFRNRIAQGQGLAMSEFIYSVVMAIDSVNVHADVELGGLDQLLNMQMGRKVMEIVGQAPQIVITMPLIEGTDGTGAKMSKSKGNYIPLTALPEDVFGKIMSIPDRLMLAYLKAWSEWTNTEIDAVAARLDDGSLHPMDLKKVVAGEAVAAVHGVDAAREARRHFTLHFSKRSFDEVEDMPRIGAADGALALGKVLTNVLGFTPSISAARRLAQQTGLRLVVETASGQKSANIAETDIASPLRDIVQRLFNTGDFGEEPRTAYLKAGRRLARIDAH